MHVNFLYVPREDQLFLSMLVLLTFASNETLQNLTPNLFFEFHREHHEQGYKKYIIFKYIDNK